MEYTSRYIEGPVLLKTVIGLDMQFCGYKWGSTELFCLNREELDLMIHQGGIGVWIIGNQVLHNVLPSCGPTNLQQSQLKLMKQIPL